MSTPNSYFITTPIYYVNDVPHIGHAYTTIACDAMARFMRLDGKEVMFLTGTDEHGQKVEKSAQLSNETPEAFTDRVSQRFRDLADKLEISNDDFIRTTEGRHAVSSQAIWNALNESGDIYLGSYSGWYSIRDEAFFTENELTKSDEVPDQLLAPSGAPVEWVEEPSYFFRLSEWGDRLQKFYEDKPDFILPESRRNEVISFVKGGLQDLSVSRTSFKWGISVPENEHHIMYVWLDALTNYITASGYPNTSSDLFTKYWPANVHVVGKDILRFHAVYWPAFLMSAGLEPPQRVFAHGWWTVNGQKMSKSLKNVVDPFALVEEFGIDAVRYFLLREVPFGKDGDFSEAALVHRVNSDLSNDFGNLCQRVLSMIYKNCGATFPIPGQFIESDNELLQKAEGLLELIRPTIERQSCNEALEDIWKIIRMANSYVDHQAPWSLRKTDPERMQTVLYVLAECIRKFGILLQPFIPNSATQLLNQLGVAENERTFSFLGIDNRLLSGTTLSQPKGIFPRIQDTEKPMN